MRQATGDTIMKRVVAYTTSDGAMHASFRAANKHAETRYGDLLTKLAHEAVHIDKYMAMTEWINANLQSFSALLSLHADLSVFDEVDPDD
jgi:hypothetical protein